MKAVLVTLVCYAMITLYSTSVLATVYKWNPASGSSAKNKANWRTSCGTPGTVFPASGDTLEFNGSCSDANCVLDTTFNVAMINVKSSYSGDITVSGSIALTFAEGIFLGGTFNGGSIPITFTASLRINGNAFTSTSAILSIAGDFTYNGSSFTHNGGTVLFKKGSATTTVFSGTSNGGTSLTLYKAEFAATAANTQFMIRNITVHVLNEMKLSGTYQLFLNTNTSSTVEVQGNIISSNTASVGGGTVLLLVNGTGAQTINDNQGTSISGKLPNIKINKASGTLSLYGSIGMGGSTSLEYVAGTISAGTSRLVCYYNNTLYNNSGGTMTLSKLDWIGSGGTHTVTGKIMVSDTFSTSGTGNCVINGDTLELQGNMVWNNTSSGSGGNVVYKFSGSAEQIISGAVTVPLSKVRLKKSSGDISLLTPVNITTDLKFETGYIVSDTVNSVIFKHGATATGASENSFVKGTVKKIGNSSFVFPVGKDTIFNPIAITAPSSSTDAFKAEYFNIIAPFGLDRDSLTYTSLCEYWTMDRTAGTANVKVTLYWNSNSCDIYTLSTLRIGRWDGFKWNNTGTVTTTGNTTSGTVQTYSNQSAFGAFIIAKRSPTITANAGSNATISMGSTATLGGSPAATGGVSPYTYTWFADYALSSASSSNPTAKPFATTTYYLKVTDSDLSFDWDTVIVTVNGFDLKTAKRFPLLTGDSLKLTSSTSVVGAVGVRQSIVGTIVASDSILINTTSSNLALRHLDTAMTNIDGLSASTISSELGGNTYSPGVYRISGNATLNGTITLDGDEESFFVFDINGTWNIASGGSIALTGGVSSDQVFFNIGSDITILGSSSVLNGQILGRGKLTGNISSGAVSVQVHGILSGSIQSSFKMPIQPITGLTREIRDYFGLNGAVVIQDFGWGTDPLPGTSDALHELLPQLHPSTFRYPGGSDATWWRWQTGWFRGYNNPLYNDDFNLNTPSLKYYDPYPLPANATGISPDKNVLKPWPDDLLDFKLSIDATAATPMFDLNVVTSDIGTEIGSLFYAHCKGLPVKYIELGNEIFSNDQDKINKYGTSMEYVEISDGYAEKIKSYFPNAKIGINASVTTPVDLDGRRNEWNNAIETYIGSNTEHFDALTYHIYPQLDMPPSVICDLTGYKSDPSVFTDYFFTTAFKQFHDMNADESGEPQKELSLCNYPTGNLEAWITEYNVVDNEDIDISGTWAHGLFVNAMTLAALDYEAITKMVCYAMTGSAKYDVMFDNEQGFDAALTCTAPGPATTAWTLGAVGKALQYVALAAKQAHHATKIEFPGCAKLESYGDASYNPDAITGWIFDCYRGLDANEEWIGDKMAVITNLTDSEQEIFINGLFPLGGTYEILTQIEDNDYPSPLKQISNLGDQISESVPAILQLGTQATLAIPKYSIVLIKFTYPVYAPVHLEASTLTQCALKEVTLYLGGGTSYYIYPPSAQGSIVSGPSVQVYPTFTNNNYKVWQMGSSNIQSSIEIEVSAVPYSPVTETSGTPCAGSENVLNASLSGLDYNWYPFETSMSSNDESSATVSPQTTTTYTLNVTNQICYCGTFPFEVEKYPVADAGPDMVACAITSGTIPFLGSEIVYPAGTTFEWSPSSALGSTDDADLQNPLINIASELSTSFTFEVTSPDCPMTSDEAIVDVVVCCEDGFDPFPVEDYPNGGSFFSSMDLIEQSVFEPNIELVDDVYTLIGYDDDIIINGKFIINNNFAFQGCDNIKLGPKAQIIVEPNYQFKISNSNLDACGEEMWKGILIDANIVANSNGALGTGLIIQGGSIISDAETAVDGRHDSQMNITASNFKRNWEGIKLSNYQAKFQGSIDNNVFDCSTCATNMLPPHPNLRTLSAIHLESIPGTASLIYDNQINEAEYGIYAVNSGFDAEANGPIENVGTGIYVFEAIKTVKLKDNTFNGCNIGIAALYNTHQNVLIEKNTITTFEIDVSEGIYPIGIQVIDIDCTDPLDCEGGQITIGNLSNGEKGNTINSEGMAGISVEGTLNALIGQNKILMNQDATSIEMWGIKMDGAIGATLEANKINDLEYGDYTLDCNPTSECSTVNKVAITILDSPGSDIICNRLNATETGLQFLKSVDDDISLAATVRGNTFQWHDDGLGIGGNGILNTAIGPQELYLGETPGNYWKGDGTLDHDFGIAALHTYGTDNIDINTGLPALFKVNEDSYISGWFFPNSNIADIILSVGTPVFIDPQDADHFECDEEQGRLLSLNYHTSDSMCCFIFPNPATERLSLKYNLIEGGNYRVVICDIAGQELFSTVLVGGINTSEVISPKVAGTYLVRIMDDTACVFQQKLIVIK